MEANFFFFFKQTHDGLDFFFSLVYKTIACTLTICIDSDINLKHLSVTIRSKHITNL